jgi:AraC-like DNA-binding protein
MEGFVAVFFWQHELDPGFPLSLLEYETCAADDRMHWHEYFEIALCLEGGGRFQFGRRSYPAEPGDVFLIDDAEPHVGVADASGRMRLLLTLFRPELIAAPGARSFDAEYLSPFRCGGRPFANRLPAGGAAACEVRPILLELKEIWDREDPGDRHLLDANLRRVLGVLVRHARAHESERDDAGAPAGAEGPADRHEHVRPVLSYVEQHFRESLTLERVSEHVHVSASRVRHLFKDATSVGFKEYVTNLRLVEAKRLLLTSDLCVQEVAYTVGYTNLNQFYKVFGRYSSMSPADYRRYYQRPGGAEVVLRLDRERELEGPVRVA